MKRVLAVASAFALVMVAFGFMIATRQAIPTNLNRAQVANHFTDDRQDFSSEEASAGEQGTLGGDRDGTEICRPRCEAILRN